MSETLTILGSGAAGCTAAIYAARAAMDPLVIEGGQPGGQLTTTTVVENFPGFADGVNAFDLMAAMRRQAERFGARFQPGRVTGCDLSRRPFRLDLDDGSTADTRTLIVATGATARYLGLPSEQALRGRGVSACATCDGAFHKGEPVAVVGGGDTAMEEALFLTRFASEVFLIHRRDEFRASRILAERALKNPKIRVLRSRIVTEVLDPEKGGVTGVRLRNLKSGGTEEFAIGGFFAAIGHQPNTEPFAGQLERNEQGYLKTRNTRTNVAGVFAAGDVQDSAYRQAVTAAGSGCMAALEVERFLESE